MHLLLQSRLKAFCGSVISSKNGNYKKRLVQVYIKNASTRKIYLSISTSDGSKIERIYAVARQGNLDCTSNSYFLTKYLLSMLSMLNWKQVRYNSYFL